MRLLGYRDSKKNPTALTPWTIIHFIVGVTFALVSRQLGFTNSLVLFIIIHTLYEVKDVYYGSSVLNSVFDEIFAVLGFLAFYYFKMNTSQVITFVIASLLLMISPSLSEDGSWTLDIWNSRG